MLLLKSSKETKKRNKKS